MLQKVKIARHELRGGFRLDFQQLKDYLAVVEHGSILAAAEATGASQPTLSRKIRELEDSLGVLLLNRTSRGVSLTVYGETFKQHAERLLREHQLLHDELRALKNGTHGHARLGLAPALSGYLPKVIDQLRHANPGVTFEVLESTYDLLVEKTIQGEIDGAFTMLPPGESLESLAVRTIGREPVVVVADASHPLRDAARIRIESLKEESWILMNRPRSIIDAFYQLAKEQGLESPNVSIETSSLEFLKSMIRHSGLLSVLPKGAIYTHLTAKTKDISLEAINELVRKLWI